jgi:hypothetical protein
MILSDAISITELVNENDKRFNNRSLNCNVYMMDYEKKSYDDRIRYLFLVKCNESYSKTSGHIVTLVFDKNSTKKGKPLTDDVRVHCQCPSFIFFGPAYNSTNPVTGDSYNLDIIENRPPDIRDPFRKVKVCKHIVRVKQALRGLSYTKLDHKVGLTAAMNSLDIPVVPIQEAFGVIINHIEAHCPDINPLEFISTITKENFETKLLQIKAII